MRVLYVNHVGILGGAERSLLGLIESLDRASVEAHLAAPDGGLVSAVAERDPGLTTHRLPACRLHRPQGLAGLWNSFRALQRYSHALRHVVRAVQPDLIHANSLTAAWAATRCLPPLSGGGRGGTPVLWHCRDLRFPAQIAQAVRPKVARVIAISQAVAEAVASLAPNGAAVSVVYNGFTPREVHVTRRRSQVREDWELGPDTPVIGCMGQLVPWKRQDVLLRALPAVLAAVPQARVVMMGDDPFGEHPEYLAALTAQAEDLGVADRVHWAGQVAAPADALAALDVLAHPADEEPFGRAVMEALALGVPVVAVNQAGPAEIIEDGRSGLLVPPNDPAAMAEAIVRILRDVELRESISDGARIRAAHFTAVRMAEQVLALYHEVLGRGGLA